MISDARHEPGSARGTPGSSGPLGLGVSLAQRSTMRIDAVAEHFAAPASVEDLVALLAGEGRRIRPLRVLGGGSNLVFASRRIAGLVVSTERLRSVRFDGRYVTVGAGCSLAGLIGKAITRRLAGLETLAGIPGTVGGAVAQNAGGRHGEIGPLVRECLLVHADGAVERRRDFAFAYRESGLKGSVVAEVTLELDAGADLTALRARYLEIMAAKSASQPLAARSAGCVFKNPAADVAAARLIDQAGWKGRGRGAAIVSPRHANFVVNRGGASPDEVTGLIHAIEADILARSGIRLEREVEYW